MLWLSQPVTDKGFTYSHESQDILRGDLSAEPISLKLKS